MSTLIVEVCKIEKVLPHANADALELAQIKGWQCVIPKGKYAADDLVTYIPIDAMIPAEHSDRWGITKYLSRGRVRCARLRGEPSFGVIVEKEDDAWIEGQDVQEHYGITKYLPPVREGGDFAPEHSLFASYTEVENLRNFPTLFAEGEEVVVTEKIHGTNCRLGLINGELMAGSMGKRRQRPEVFSESLYWLPMAIDGVQQMLENLGLNKKQVILYGEVFGSKIQSLHYGHIGTLAFRAFDLMVEGSYLDADEFIAVCGEFGIPTAPVLYRGQYALATIKALSEGVTTLGADHIREGVVVRPATERSDPKVGRVCLKYIGDSYLFAKGVTDTNDI